MRDAVQQDAVAVPIDPDESRMISGLRLLLAVAALAITHIDPSEPSRFAATTYSVLILYVLYSGAVYLTGLRGFEFAVPVQRTFHWIDLAFYICLIGLSNGTNSIYFIFFFFCIIVASFRWGFGPGIRVTAVSVALFVIVGYAARPPASEFDLDRFILRASALPVLGYMMAYWGGYELRLKRRLGLLREISTLSNPRFGVDRTLGAGMERLRAFYSADDCVALLSDAGQGGHLLRRARAGNPDAALRAEPVLPALAGTLLAVGEDAAVSFQLRHSWWPPCRLPRAVKRALPAARGTHDLESCRDIAEALDTSAFLTVPMRSRSRVAGRLFLTSRRRPFHREDLDFLGQVIDNLMPVLDHIALVDRMATRAAEDERQRIARDIHDRIVQPYIGLQLGITSIRELLDRASGNGTLAQLQQRAATLDALAGEGVADLRRYVRQLKYGEDSNGSFVEGVRRFASRFYEATGIEVDVKAEDGLHVHDRLAAEVFSMLTEALSNIRRHTRALRCSVELRRSGESLVAMVTNGSGTEGPAAAFTPHSIAERAASLHGTVTVKTPPKGDTAVVIEIPL